jgi:hypothetical protein
MNLLIAVAHSFDSFTEKITKQTAVVLCQWWRTILDRTVLSLAAQKEAVKTHMVSLGAEVQEFSMRWIG